MGNANEMRGESEEGEVPKRNRPGLDTAESAVRRSERNYGSGYPRNALIVCSSGLDVIFSTRSAGSSVHAFVNSR